MIAVLGATGFIGAALTQQLASGDEPVRVLVRDRGKAEDRLGRFADRVEIITGDMHDPAALDALLDGVRAVFVLVQTVTARQPSTAGGYADAERQAMQALVAAARRAKVRRVLTVGLIGASPSAANPWVRSRAELTQALLASGLDVTVLRAGLVVGIGGTGYDRLLAVARGESSVVLGGGGQRWSYIALSDVVGYLVDAIDEPSTFGKAMDVGSLETPTYSELLSRTAAVIGRRPPRPLWLPLRLVVALAPLIERLGRLPKGGLRTAILHLGDDLVGDPLPVRALLARDLLDWEQAVAAAAAPGRLAGVAG